MKQITAIILICFFAQNVYCQKRANKWYYGNKAALDFNSGTPVPVIGSAMNISEGCASIADKNTGALLFYTSGDSVWDANNTLMPNGWDLKGTVYASCANNNGTQNALIIPWPGNDSLYYIFTTHCINDTLKELSYSVVNMNLNGGLGDVISKNNVLYTPVTEKLTGVKHANGCDYWMIAHDWDDNNFLAYQVTSTGINAPVSSGIGSVQGGAIQSGIGYMRVSPNGSKLALVYYGAEELYDFNNNTGVVSNYINLSNACPVNYAVCFSPDNSKLYTDCYQGFGSNIIYQYNLLAGSSAAIVASRTAVATTSVYGALQLAPDGKIYKANYTSSSLGVINSPNLQGTACDYVDNVISSGLPTIGGLPNFIESYFDSGQTLSLSDFTYADTCFGDTTLFTSSPVVSEEWNFGDIASGSQNTALISNPTHIFSAPGSYTVTHIISTGCEADTTILTVNINPLPLLSVTASPDTICVGDFSTLTATAGVALNYLWNPALGLSDTTGTSVIASPLTTTTYSVTGTGLICPSGIATITIIVNPIPLVNAGNDTVVDPGTSLTLNGTGQGTLVWSENGTTLSCYTCNNPMLVAQESAMYYLTTTDNNGCTNTDSIYVEVSSQFLLFIPNAFTPDNKDGINDEFFAKGSGIQKLEMMIFNRWGEKIFETDTYGKGWDGTFKGIPAESGVYIYSINAQSLSGDKIKKMGYVALIK